MTPNGERLRSTTWWNTAFILVLAVVLVARCVAIVDALRSPEPVATSFDEDAYYAFAVARNVAAGHGIAAAHGEPTSGFQPLWTFLLVPAFALFNDGRAVLTSIFLLSTAVWLAAAWLFAGLMTRHVASSEASLGGLAGLLCVIAFLCDPRLGKSFFSGLETGCYAAGLLFLCRWLDVGRPLDAQASWHRSVAFGLFLGLLLLARNDAVLIVPFVLLAAAVAHTDRRTLQRIVVAAAVAAVTFSPWVAYNYGLTGTILPQGGLATSVRANGSALDWFRVSAATRVLLELTAPPLVPAVARMPTWCLAACAVVLCAGFIGLCRHNAQAKRMARSTAWFRQRRAAALVVYYLLFSAPRGCIRTTPICPLALGARLWLVPRRPRQPCAHGGSVRRGVPARRGRDEYGSRVPSFGSSTPYMGEEPVLLIATGPCSGPARVGMPDSGRIGCAARPTSSI
jgi:hypothetical protein